jgi:EAL domain-containing protein (putative c-di-GMP-specific phosphodiesterase class I)/GGDEF domain-containing protein
MNRLKKCKEGKKCKKCLQFSLIIIMIIFIDFFVYFSGGTASSIPSMLYVPIIFASFAFSMEEALVVACIAGISVGPFMPLHVNLGIMQPTHGWLLRLSIFLLISITINYLVYRNTTLNKQIQEKAYENPYVGLPNVNKFFHDIEEHFKENPSRGFTILAFKYENFKQISRNIDLFVGRKSIQYLLTAAKDYFNDKPIYACHLDEFIIILPETDVAKSCTKAEQFIMLFDKLHYVNKIPLFFQLKCGIVNYPLHGSNTKTVLQNLARIIEQVENSDKKIVIYDGYLAERNLENYHNLIRFMKDFKDEKLTLFYQPKIDIKSDEVIGFEALLRWKDPTMNYTPIDKVIKAVENAGMIGQVTKWVAERAIIQISEWQKIGININVSVNLSSKDLINGALLEYTKKYIKKYKIDPEYFEYELTERSLIENHGKSVTYLNELKNLGLKISIDDYGVGYNSLLNMISLPVDYIKIDKCFIKNMDEAQGKNLVEDMISLIHNLGKKVLAEGVEKAEQEKMLKELDCDYVQGYYYSRPMPSEQVVDFLNDFNMLEDCPESLNLA